MTLQVMTPPQVRPADVAAVRDHPGFRAAVEGYCAASLARYRALTSIERWMISDMGRASLSGVAMVLGASGALTPRALLGSQPVTRGVVSRGRVRLYLERALANDLFRRADSAAGCGLDAALAPQPRFYAVMTGVLDITLAAVGDLFPEVATARARLQDPAFTAALSIGVGLRVKAQQDLFPQGGVVQMLQDRDGGARLIEALVLRQESGRTHLLETCRLSRSALASASFCSRVHVNRLLADAEAQGLLTLDGTALHVAPDAAEAVASHFAAIFAITRAAAAAVFVRP